MTKQKKLTEAYVKRTVAYWIDAMRLSHWKLEVVIGSNEVKDGCAAHIEMSHDYNSATIRFNTEWASWTDEKLDEVIVHELTHAHLHQFENAAKEVEFALGREACALYESRLEHEIEAATEAISWTIISLARSQ